MTAKVTTQGMNSMVAVRQASGSGRDGRCETIGQSRALRPVATEDANSGDCILLADETGEQDKALSGGV